MDANRSRQCAVLAVVGMMLFAGVVQATVTGNWTTNGSTSATASARGIAVTQSGSPGNAYATGTMGSGAFWTEPYGGTVAGSANLTLSYDGRNRSFSVTFSEPVDNPVLHVDRLGGTVGSGFNSAVWVLSSSVSQGGNVVMERLSGNSVFVLNANGVTGFRRLTGGNSTGSSTNCLTANTGMACGSIRFNGTGITSLTFNVSMRGGIGAGDLFELLWSVAGSQVAVVKQSEGASTASFPFSGSNGVGSFNLDTGSANPASSATFDVIDHANPITISEGQTASFALREAHCADQNGDHVASVLSGATLTISAASYGGNQLITCTFINSMLPVLRLQKQLPKGRFGAGDQFNLSISGPGVSATTTTTGSGSMASGIVSTGPAAPGDTYTFSETVAAGNLDNYSSSYSCTNANPGGTPNSSGNARSFTLTPQAEDDFTCVFSNTRAALADLMISKSASETSVLAGATISYTLVVSNSGDVITGAVVADQPDAGLSCPGAGNPDMVSCIGIGCAGPYTVSALIGSGITLGTLDQDNSSVSLAYTCTVQ